MNALYYISILPIGSEKLVRIDSQVYRLTTDKNHKIRKFDLNVGYKGDECTTIKNIVSFKEN